MVQEASKMLDISRVSLNSDNNMNYGNKLPKIVFKLQARHEGFFDKLLCDPTVDNMTSASQTSYIYLFLSRPLTPHLPTYLSPTHFCVFFLIYVFGLLVLFCSIQIFFVILMSTFTFKS